jgi:hypothetical protein
MEDNNRGSFLMMGDIIGYWKNNHLHLTINVDGNKLITSLSEEQMDKIEKDEVFQMGDVDVYTEGNKVYIPFTIGEHITSVGLDINSLFDVAEKAEEKVDKVENPVKDVPINDPKWANAIKNSKNFNMSEVEKFTKATIDLPKDGEPVSLYGKIHSIVYMNDKEGLGENQQYIHHFKEPYPLLVHSGNNKKPVYIIFGGKTYISEPGDSSGEAPGWMID